MNNYYFISDKRIENEVLYPRVPHNRLTVRGLEENKTPRICVSKSILGCLKSTGLYQNRKILYLYLCYAHTKDVKQPCRDEVNDSIWTGEEWVLVPVEMHLLTVLHVSKQPISQNYCKYIIEDKKSDGYYKIEICEFDYDRYYKRNRKKERLKKKLRG